MLSVHLAVYEGAMSVAVFTAFVLVTGAYVLRGVWRDEPDLRLADGPAIDAVVPAYRDAAVIEGCVESLLDSDYGSVVVTVVVEPDDPPTPSRRPGAAIPFVPLVHVGHCVLTVKALLEYALTWEGKWYRVTKGRRLTRPGRTRSVRPQVATR